MILGLGLLGFIGFLGIAVDGLWVQMARTQAQFAADAGAHGALVALRTGANEAEARQAARIVMQENAVANSQVRVTPLEDIVFGQWDYKFKSFDSASPDYLNAVVAQVRRTPDSPGGPIPLFIGPIFGNQSANVSSVSQSTAAMRTRNIVIAQDITGSFRDEMQDARGADTTLLGQIHEAGFPGDKVGLALFTGGSRLYTRLDRVDAPAAYAVTRQKWMTFPHCDSMEGDPDLDCSGWTNPAAGLEVAIDELELHGNREAVKVIVLVTDGAPESATSQGWDAARAADAERMADEADAVNISIFVVSLNSDGVINPRQTQFCQSMIRGFGVFYETPDSDELRGILKQIAHTIPIALVR
jgi:hypothetical protein